MCQGMAESALGEEDAPDHVTLWRRIKAMEVRQEGNITTVRNGNDVLCLHTGRHRTGTGHAKRLDTPQAQEGARIHQAERHDKPGDPGDSFRVTDERKGDSSQFKDLVDGSLEALGLDSESLRVGVLAKGAANAQGTDAATAGSAPKDPQRKAREPQAPQDPQNGTACCLSALQGMPEGSL